MATNNTELRAVRTRPKLTSHSRERLSRITELLTRFAISFVLAGASILLGVSPFAASFAASSGAGPNALSAMLGALIGYLIFGSFLRALKYICITLLVTATAIVFRFTVVYRSRWFMPVAAGATALFITLITSVDGGWTRGELVQTACDTVLCLGCTYFYKIALSPWSGRFDFDGEVVHTVSVLILLCTILISLSGFELFGVLSMGRAAAVLLVFLASYKGGVGIGCATGISVGLAMDVGSASSPMFAMAYGVSGLIAGVFSQHSRLVFALSFILADAAAAVVAMQSAAVPSILYEVFAASVVFMLLPSSFISRIGSLLPSKLRGGGVNRAREYTRVRVEQASLAFRELCDAAKSAELRSRGTDSAAVIFDRAAEGACRRCTNANRCWHDEYNNTVDVMNNITPIILKRGSLEATDFPSFFTDSCTNLDGLTAAINTELRAFLYRRQLRNRLRGNQTAVFSQYSEIADILSGISDELGSSLRFEPDLESKTRKYLQSQGIVADVAIFHGRNGRLHAEISSAELHAFLRDKSWLDKLSVVLGMRLCVPESRPRSGRLELLEAEPYSAEIGVSRVGRHGSNTSGDTGAYFKTDDGILYILLSDGMGAGHGAAELSSDTVRILERFLRSGIVPETAVRMLNDIMLLRNDADVGFATVDLACVDLFSGETTLLKYGAAPSYVKSGGTVKRVQGRALAAGLGAPPHNSPDSAVTMLRPGMFVVVVSDGALPDSDDSALLKLISGFDGLQPKELTRAIVAAARSDGKAEDDITAIAIRLAKRE